MATTTLLEETRLSITKLAHEQDVAVSTVWRWAQRGVRGATLETFAVGGKRFTTRESFARFVEKTNAVADRRPPPNPTRSRAIEIAAAKEQVLDLLD